jgi:hypothetical protein
MANITKKTPVFDVQVGVAEGLSVHGGLVALDALARQYGLWEKIRAIRSLDLRKDTSHGFSPEVLVAQLVFSLCSGGAGLSDAERLGRDKTIAPLLGISSGADASTLGEWLRGQSEENVAALEAVVRGFVAWALERAQPERVRRDGVLEVFFDDTQIELHGRYFEGAKINYNGDLALSWQTFWTGPFMTAGRFGPASGDKGEEVSEHLPALMELSRPLWQQAARDGQAHFYADSGSSAGKYLQLIDGENWGWSVSYNKWTTIPERLAQEVPDERWTAEREAAGRQGQAVLERHGWVRHQPGEDCDRALDFAVVRWRDKDGLTLHHHAFVVGRAGRTTRAHDPQAAAELFARHRLKGARERAFSELLSDLDLHHPPCQSLAANRMFYAIGMLAYDLLVAFRVLCMDGASQEMRARSLIRHLMTTPLKLVRHAHRTRARLLCPLNWLRWWQLFIRDMFPTRKRGRQPKSGVPPSG